MVFIKSLRKDFCFDNLDSKARESLAVIKVNQQREWATERRGVIVHKFC